MCLQSARSAPSCRSRPDRRCRRAGGLCAQRGGSPRRGTGSDAGQLSRVLHPRAPPPGDRRQERNSRVLGLVPAARMRGRRPSSRVRRSSASASATAASMVPCGHQRASRRWRRVGRAASAGSWPPPMFSIQAQASARSVASTGTPQRGGGEGEHRGVAGAFRHRAQAAARRSSLVSSRASVCDRARGPARSSAVSVGRGQRSRSSARPRPHQPSVQAFRACAGRS